LNCEHNTRNRSTRTCATNPPTGLHVHGALPVAWTAGHPTIVIMNPGDALRLPCRSALASAPPPGTWRAVARARRCRRGRTRGRTPGAAPRVRAPTPRWQGQHDACAARVAQGQRAAAARVQHAHAAAHACWGPERPLALPRCALPPTRPFRPPGRRLPRSLAGVG
jgi:hypothetical protein